MSLEVLTVMHSENGHADAAMQREELVRRVASSVTFEKSPRLRAFFLHVCRCARENKSEEATEPQIAIYVYGRRPGYNPNEDNIVRSQARMLRMKLEHHFANEGKDEPIIISIPKGQYLPIFETRSKEAQVEPLHVQPRIVAPDDRKPSQIRACFGRSGYAVCTCRCMVWVPVVRVEAYPFSILRRSRCLRFPATTEGGGAPAEKSTTGAWTPTPAGTRFAAGHTGASYVDMWGRRWESDRYYDGGVSRPGPLHFFPPVADKGLFSSIREAASDDIMVPESQRGFRYNIPLSPGVYELRLYFADPLRQPDADQKEDAQNYRHFAIDLNGHPLLVDFDPVDGCGVGGGGRKGI